MPPGLWIDQIAQRVGQLPDRRAQAFIQDTHNNSVRSVFEPQGVNNLEGLTRPDTYNISNSQDEISILQTMVTAFDTKAKKMGVDTADVEGHTAYDIIKIASLIESEAKVPQDRPLIASVIYNRLRQNMKLQIDSTVIYAPRRLQEPPPHSRRPRERQVAVQHVPEQRLAADADRHGQ